MVDTIPLCQRFDRSWCHLTGLVNLSSLIRKNETKFDASTGKQSAVSFVVKGEQRITESIRSITSREFSNEETTLRAGDRKSLHQDGG